MNPLGDEGKGKLLEEYIGFYEKYRDGTATPQSSWHGREYEDFRSSLSSELGLDETEIEDCFFIKDDEGKYYLAPVSTDVNLNILSTENYVPFERLLMYEGDENFTRTRVSVPYTTTPV